MLKKMTSLKDKIEENARLGAKVKVEKKEDKKEEKTNKNNKSKEKK